jgi:hypothetical protein
MKLTSAKNALAGLVLAAALSGCVVAPVPGPYGNAVVTYSAPPAPQVEVVGVAPTPGYFWVGGSWFWEGGRYAWHPGFWQAPRPGYRWVPHNWARAGGGGWRMEPGHWQRYR